MEDKEVKDKTVPDKKAPEKQKDLKKPSGKSATGKPLDGIDINPQLNDVSTDGNLLKVRKEDSVDLTAPVIQERKALTIPERQLRARNLRRRQQKIERAREVAKHKLAPASKIKQRAVAHAREIVKKRFASRKGVPYAELTTAEKIRVDTAVAKKTKLIQRIAARLLPRLRKAEFERLQAFRHGKPLQDLSTQNPKSQGIMPKVSEEMAHLFDTLDGADTNSLIGIIEDTIKQFNEDNNPMGEQLKKMLNAVLPEDVITESLMKKSEKTGISFSTLKEVFDRGEYSWDESNRMTQEQYAFARVNSYIAKGKAWHMDADLREEKIINEKLDASFSAFLEANLGTKERKKIELVDRVPADQAVKAKQAEIQKKIIDEARAPGTPSIKRYKRPDGTTALKSLNKWGKRKDWHDTEGGLAKAKQHSGADTVTEEGNYQSDPKKREVGTKSLVKAYKKDTPCAESTDLNENFNMAWTSGIGVTLSAADCGIQIKGGFALHPDVIEQMAEIEEDVVAADRKPVYVKPRRHKDGSFGKSSTEMRRSGKKIIDVKEPEDVDSDEHDGK